MKVGLMRSLIVADGNEAHREDALRILERMGFVVLCAVNGSEVLRLLEDYRPDAVLIDVDVPATDGFATTTRIRTAERETGDRLPIVGIASDSGEEFRSRCLAEGLDGLVVKPLNQGDLQKVLCEVLENGDCAGTPKGCACVPSEEAERSNVLEAVGHDRELLTELVGIFFEVYPGMLAEIESAQTERDWEGLRRAAHKLKGSVGNFTTGPAYGAAEKVERRGYSSDASRLPDAIDALKRELETLRRVLVSLSEYDPGLFR